MSTENTELTFSSSCPPFFFCEYTRTVTKKKSAELDLLHCNHTMLRSAWSLKQAKEIVANFLLVIESLV